MHFLQQLFFYMSIASTFKNSSEDYLIICQDREEAAYLQNDLQNLLEGEILTFPMSYKRPYEFDETENANILTSW